MFRRQLCTTCKTGAESYSLDRGSTICPYIYAHDGKKCIFYKKNTRQLNLGIGKRIVSLLKTRSK